ncbi:hypothetical protein [Methanococcus maripaludis]|uniref:Uncharacterized protein n=1 Tax=Methanococcus maripaludis TaxID=39152 RepID=A0A7J9SCY6_METMI|nr:hypothetical protein [Methanococcus maripaludis]MBB6497791.1 hypothetical protein [Methanococcus maripaludis]
MIYYNSFLGDIGIKILEKDTNTRNARKLVIIGNSFTKKYFLSFLSQKIVKNYLKYHAHGITKYLSIKDILNLKIPLNHEKIRYGVSSIEFENLNTHTEILKLYYEDYIFLIKNKKEVAAAALMGSVCESILISKLLENGFNKLDFRKNSTLGILLKLANENKLFPESNSKIHNRHFQNVMEARNLIHTKVFCEKIIQKDKMLKKGFTSFEWISKEYGLI